MTFDIFIGFEEEPKELEAFLKKEGYTQIDRQTEEGCTIYNREDNPWPQLFYHHSKIKAEEPKEVPNWSNSRFNIVAELNINYTNEEKAMDEAERLSEKIVRKLNGILYDSNLDEYFAKEDI